MRLVYMGTPEFAVPPLEALTRAGHDVSLVVTRPDRPKGRGLSLEASPVKSAAISLGLPVFQPERPNRDDSVERLRAERPDALVVVAYGAILREPLLTLAPKGALNVHASLLPRYRGMAPIQRAIWDGEEETGITTMYMDKGVDTGDMILKEALPIGPDETGGELHDRLSQLGARLIVDTLARIEEGQAPRTPQSGPGSYAGRLDKEHGYVNWSLDAGVVHNHLRAVTPWPGATAFLGSKPVVILSSRVAAPEVVQAPAGTILGLFGEVLRVACGTGSIDLLQVKPAGKGSMAGADFARGRRLVPGASFDTLPLPPREETS